MSGGLDDIILIVMICPKDGHVLQSFDADGIKLNECASCAGIWLEKKQFQMAVEKFFEDDERARHLHPEIAKRAKPRHDSPDDAGIMQCPGDRSELHEIRFSTDADVTIEHCMKCGGFWCGGGELEKIHEYLSPSLEKDEFVRELIKEAQEADRANRDLTLLHARAAYHGSLMMRSPWYIVHLIVIFIIKKMFGRPEDET